MTKNAMNASDGALRPADLPCRSESHPPHPSHSGQLSVLIIEDISDIGLARTLPLERRGFDVAVAASHEEGVERAVRGEPDVIVLDLGPRDLDGIGVIRVLRSVPMTREIPFVILTDQEPHGIERVVRGWQVVRHVLKKPVAGDQLARIISTLSDADSVR